MTSCELLVLLVLYILLFFHRIIVLTVFFEVVQGELSNDDEARFFILTGCCLAELLPSLLKVSCEVA